jgi:hypothetical protein
MDSAVERLATELMKLPAGEWQRHADQDHDRQASSGSAWEEFSERLAPPELRQALPTEPGQGESIANGK